MLLRNPFTHDARVLREARSLAKAGYEVTVLAVRAGELPVREERDGFLVHRAIESRGMAGPTIEAAAGAGARRNFPRLAFLVWLRDQVLARRMTKAALSVPADVYHAHDLNTLEPAVTAARRFGARLVYDAHELYPDLTALGRGESRRWRRLERKLIGRADAVITPSRSRADELVVRYGIPEPVVVMNCPPAGPAPDPGASPLAKLRRDRETLLVYAGGYTPNRGLEAIVRAMEQLEGCRLLMLGLGPLESELRRLASDRVVFVPPVEPDEVVPMVAGADIGVAPYLPIGRNNELAAPNKLFEYLQAGLAIAASDLPEMREIIEGNDLGVTFDAWDVRSFVLSIRQLRKRLCDVKRNALHVASSYSWESQETRLLETYDCLRMV